MQIAKWINLFIIIFSFIECKPKKNIPAPNIIVAEIPTQKFKMAVTEITIQQYLPFCEEVEAHYPKWLAKNNEYNIYEGTEKDYYKNIGMSEKNLDYPITGVTHRDAEAYCKWLSKKTKQIYRLPTEKEWEFAAKGGEDFDYAGANKIAEVAWYNENAKGTIHPVKQKKPNKYGLYDMSGNAWEWTSSVHSNDYRILHGGSWYFGEQSCNIKHRGSELPTNHANFIGFRVVLESQN